MGDNFTNIFMGFLSFNYRLNYITNSSLITQKDTTIENNLLLPSGGQFSKPINMDGYWSAMSFFTYGFPLVFMKSNFSLNFGGQYSSSPSLVNNIKNISNAYNYNLMFVLSSNISEDLDFTVSARGIFNTTNNSIQKTLDNKYNNYNTSLFINWIFWSGFFIQADARQQYYTGLVGQSQSNYTLLNFSIGTKLFARNAGELKLTAFDVLNQNKSYTTNVNDLYIEYNTNQVLKQYVMLTFTYNLSNFPGVGMKKD